MEQGKLFVILDNMVYVRYEYAYYLDLIKETTITEDMSKDEIVNEIYQRVMGRNES